MNTKWKIMTAFFERKFVKIYSMQGVSVFMVINQIEHENGVNVFNATGFTTAGIKTTVCFSMEDE